MADLRSSKSSTLLTVDRTGRFEPAWSPDGRQLVYVGFTKALPSLYVVDLETGERRKIVDAVPRWMPRPHFSADGAHVYYTAGNQIYRQPIRDGGRLNPSPRSAPATWPMVWFHRMADGWRFAATRRSGWRRWISGR